MQQSKLPNILKQPRLCQLTIVSRWIFAAKLSKHIYEKPLPCQNCSWGTKRDNLHVSVVKYFKMCNKVFWHTIFYIYQFCLNMSNLTAELLVIKWSIWKRAVKWNVPSAPISFVVTFGIECNLSAGGLYKAGIKPLTLEIISLAS